MSPKIRDTVIALSFLLAAAAFAYAQIVGKGPGEARAIDARALGVEFAPRLAACLADGFEAGAEALESDGRIAEAIEKQKQVFSDRRAAEFEKVVAPAFALIVPDDRATPSRQTKIELARAWRDFASGLRGKKR